MKVTLTIYPDRVTEYIETRDLSGHVFRTEPIEHPRGEPVLDLTATGEPALLADLLDAAAAELRYPPDEDPIVAGPDQGDTTEETR